MQSSSAERGSGAVNQGADPWLVCFSRLYELAASRETRIPEQELFLKACQAGVSSDSAGLHVGAFSHQQAKWALSIVIMVLIYSKHLFWLQGVHP